MSIHILFGPEQTKDLGLGVRGFYLRCELEDFLLVLSPWIFFDALQCRGLAALGGNNIDTTQNLSQAFYSSAMRLSCTQKTYHG